MSNPIGEITGSVPLEKHEKRMLNADAKEIDRLRAKLAKAIEALKPLASYGKWTHGTTGRVVIDSDCLIRAAEVYKELTGS